MPPPTHPSTPAAAPPPSAAARRDAWWVAAATAACFVLAALGQWQEQLAAWALHWEHWQLDEAPITLLALSAGLAWYAWRRRRESLRLAADNRALAQRLLQLQEDERRAIARELHDELGQCCTALRLEAACLARAQHAEQREAAAQRIGASAERLHDGMRRLLHQLRPAELDALGLPMALRALAEHWESRSALRIAVEQDGDWLPLDPATEIALYRLAQEGLANAVRHAHARAVTVRLAPTLGSTVLTVRDDGRGFDAATRRRGLGLLGAGERAAALGGRFEVLSRAGHGTTLTMALPPRARSSASATATANAVDAAATPVLDSLRLGGSV